MKATRNGATGGPDRTGDAVDEGEAGRSRRPEKVRASEQLGEVGPFWPVLCRATSSASRAGTRASPARQAARAVPLGGEGLVVVDDRGVADLASGHGEQCAV